MKKIENPFSLKSRIRFILVNISLKIFTMILDILLIITAIICIIPILISTKFFKTYLKSINPMNYGSKN